MPFKVEFSPNANIFPIFARNTIRLLMVFTTTPNNTGENGDKKQNTLPYTLQSKVVEVCLVGAQRTIYTVTENACIFFGFAKSRAFGGAPRSDIINVVLCPTSKLFPIFRKAKRSFPLAAPPSTLVSKHLILQK